MVNIFLKKAFMLLRVKDWQYFSEGATLIDAKKSLLKMKL